MSAIFGLFQRDDRPVTAEALRLMREAMAYWGPDGGGLWQNGGAAGLGQLLTHNTPEAVHEQLPRWMPQHQLAFTAHARLDNRAELCDQFEIRSSARPHTSDGDLILQAYLQWGEDCPAHLLGDWALAAWHAEARRLFVTRDHYGNTALYYTHSPRFLAFASSLKGLLALPDTPRQLDELQLARYLTLWITNDGAPMLYQNIWRLPPAHCLTVTPDSLRVRQYWRMEDAPAVRFGSDEAYVEAFLDIYTEAVRARLRATRPVGVTLSAGLDSGSVAALAARELRAEGQTLTAFTSTPAYAIDSFANKNWFTDEWPLAHATAEYLGNVTHLPIRAEHIMPMAAMRRSLELHGWPEHAYANLPWMMGLLEAAQQHGLGALLTGQVGNGGVSWVGDRFPVWWPLRRGQWPAAWGALTAWRTAHGRSWWGAVRSQILRPLLLPMWSQRQRLAQPFSPPWQAYSPIHPAFARRLEVLKQMQAAGYDASFSPVREPRAERLATLLPGVHPMGALWHENGAGYGLEVRDPTADKRVLEFCLGLPDEQFARDGRDRWLIRRAMNGLLPPEAQWNTRRGLQGADIAQRVVANRAEMEETLAQLNTNPLAAEYLDLTRMERGWTKLQQAITPATASALLMLLRGLGTGLFLIDWQKNMK